MLWHRTWTRAHGMAQNLDKSTCCGTEPGQEHMVWHRTWTRAHGMAQNLDKSTCCGTEPGQEHMLWHRTWTIAHAVAQNLNKSIWNRSAAGQKRVWMPAAGILLSRDLRSVSVSKQAPRQAQQIFFFWLNKKPRLPLSTWWAIKGACKADTVKTPAFDKSSQLKGLLQGSSRWCAKPRKWPEKEQRASLAPRVPC